MIEDRQNRDGEDYVNDKSVVKGGYGMYNGPINAQAQVRPGSSEPKCTQAQVSQSVSRHK